MLTKFTVQERALAVPKGAHMKLTPDQARRRRTGLLPGKGKDVFITSAPCEFKVGEEVQIDLATAGLSTKVLAYINAPAKAAPAEAAAKPASTETAAGTETA